MKRSIPFVGRLTPRDLRNLATHLPWVVGVGVKVVDMKQALVIKRVDAFDGVGRGIVFSEEVNARFRDLVADKSAFVIANDNIAIFFWVKTRSKDKPVIARITSNR